MRQLEVLVGRAHGQFYSSAVPKKESMLLFFTEVFPHTFRKNLHVVAFSMALFFITALVGYFFTLADWEFAEMILSPGLIECIQNHEMWTVSLNSIKPLASSQIATNNITVTIAAFALGVFFGAGTLYIIAFNGLLFGTILAATYLYGLNDELLLFVLPHGVIELPCIFIAAAGGFIMGRALLFPGRYSRKIEFQSAARTGAELVLGTAPLLLLAGLIEAYISPSELPVAVRLTVCVLAALFMWIYLMRPFRSKPGVVPEAPAPPAREPSGGAQA
ncbi:MAG: stage II sporulation protein M [Candidatus Eremiobacteraeota bacterium]|nr:stage II sporulation protein M [Candidatus Eremiobacteraeota bacterium]